MDAQYDGEVGMDVWDADAAGIEESPPPSPQPLRRNEADRIDIAIKIMHEALFFIDGNPFLDILHVE
jgi:hypothetical protein